MSENHGVDEIEDDPFKDTVAEDSHEEESRADNDDLNKWLVDVVDHDHSYSYPFFVVAVYFLFMFTR